MDATRDGLDRMAASRLLGWLNLSDGRPDPKWQRQLDDAFASAGDWLALRRWLLAELDALADSAAFRDADQARAAVELVFEHALPAYRQHHRDLLAHLADADLFTPYFVARVFEAVLSQGGPWDEPERIVDGTLKKLNDYVGHRPVPVLETRAQIEIYPHEKVRPVPIYLKGGGSAHGRYRDLVDQALELLRNTDADLLQEASLDPSLLDELSYDPRAYDHGHPVNRRPNYLFGEWDPHHIDNKGKFRRFVVRHTTLEAILSRIPADADPALLAERKFEAGAVLAGTILMASGTSGSGPTMFDSSVTLSKLVPRIARYRDAFYKRLITSVAGKHGEILPKKPPACATIRIGPTASEPGIGPAAGRRIAGKPARPGLRRDGLPRSEPAARCGHPRYFGAHAVGNPPAAHFRAHGRGQRPACGGGEVAS